MNNLNKLLWSSSHKCFFGGKSLVKNFLRKFEE